MPLVGASECLARNALDRMIPIWYTSIASLVAFLDSLSGCDSGRRTKARRSFPAVGGKGKKNETRRKIKYRYRDHHSMSETLAFV